LLSRPGYLLSEDEQFESYRALAVAAGEDGAVIRLFDLGGETGFELSERPERNPALGLRAIRFGLKNDKVMRAQVRAILRAAKFGKLSLLIPMVADVSDVRRAKKVIDEEEISLAKDGVEHAAVRIGAMIEIPSAVLTAEKIAHAVDFFELGTNDLVQYTLAVDRGNDNVADWFRTLHPAVLFGINHTLKVAHEVGIAALVCGEMASTPAYAVLLVGMGAVELSMTPASIPRVRRALSEVDTSEAAELAERSLKCATADEVEEIVRTEFRIRWPDVFPPKALPA
jgi:phosphotransferase system enzyme I (PtsI)